MALYTLFIMKFIPQEKLELFEKNDAVLVLDSINLLPSVLNLQ